MVALRNRLAEYEIHAANYYLKRKAYVAAINRAQYVIENMQETDSMEEALIIMIEGYQHLKMHELPVRHCSIKVNFLTVLR